MKTIILWIVTVLVMGLWTVSDELGTVLAGAPDKIAEQPVYGTEKTEEELAEEAEKTELSEESALLTPGADENTTTSEVVVEEENSAQFGLNSQKLSWEAINAFSIASASMTTDELRALCVDFFRFSKSFWWTPSEDISYVFTPRGTKDSLEKGQVYVGLPYAGPGSGNIYRAMDYYDSETGIVDMSVAGDELQYFGNQCSISAYWGWGRVINSAQYSNTSNMVESKGFLKVGDYDYDTSIVCFDSNVNTETICAENGAQTMYEAYACIKPADGFVRYTTSGHVFMCSAEPVVVRNEDGTIDPENSYIIKIDQTEIWKEYELLGGGTGQGKTNIDGWVSFAVLFEKNYIPFTFAEFLGTDPVEDTECAVDYVNLEISVPKLQEIAVTANYGISDVYVYVQNKNGDVVYTAVQRMDSAGVMQTILGDAVNAEKLNEYSSGEYTVEIVCQLANGVRDTLYKGILIN